MRALVTGAAGYIGSVLVEELLRHGVDVLAFDNLRSGSRSLAAIAAKSHQPGFTFLRGDVRSAADLRPALRIADVIYPLAGVVGVKACDEDPEYARAVNLDAIRMLLTLRSPRQRIVFPSTNSGYGSRSDELTICTEETPLEPISLYGRLKAEAEAAVLESENAVSIRLATVFGYSPRMRRDLLVNHFVWTAMREHVLEIYEGHFLRNYVHVRDVAAAFFRIGGGYGSRLSEGAYNFGNDALNLSKQKLAELVAETVGNCTVVAREGQDPDRRNYQVSSKKLAQAFGLAAGIDLEYGIREMMETYRCDPELYS